MSRIAIAALFTAALHAAPVPYNPLKVSDAAVVTRTFEAIDAKRERRIPLRVYLPDSKKPAPAILFSHGLGGSRDNNPYLGNHWAKRGYVVVFVQHPGSDEAVWKNAPPLRRMGAMKEAASWENFLARTMDVPAVIDVLAKWNSDSAHPLHRRLDLEHLGMSGHSFGAITTQAVAGQTFVGGRSPFLERRIDAAVMMSPGPPAIGDPAEAFARIRVPCLIMTGTRDDSPIGRQTAADRLTVFPNLSQAPAWQVVLDEATHMSFGERDLMNRKPRNPRYHRAIQALTTAFWDAELKGDAAAKSWLNGKGARSLLAAEDVWQINRNARD
jgi:predicted dienelactone hydrolase